MDNQSIADIVEAEEADSLPWLNVRLAGIAKRQEARALHAEANLVDEHAARIELQADIILARVADKLGVRDTHEPVVNENKLAFVRK